MKRKCELCMNLRLVFPRVLSVAYRKKCFYCDFRTLIKLSEIVKYNSSSFTEELLERVEKGYAHR